MDRLEPFDPPAWAIFPDLEITRRKRYHMVIDPAGNVRFRSRVLLECVAWLDAEEVTSYRLHWQAPVSVTLLCDRQPNER